MTYPEDTTSANNKQRNTPVLGEDVYSESDLAYGKNRIRIGLTLAFIGYLIFLLGARPSLFGLDRSPVVGFVQISVFLLGLAIINLGSYMTLSALWPEGKKTIAAEIGSRLISTGYVICVFTGMADIFGLGSHPLPNVFFGPLQARGMTLGIMTVAVGFLLMIRYKRIPQRNEAASDSREPADQEDAQGSAESEPLKIKVATLFQ
jgi:hypothetical protein